MPLATINGNLGQYARQLARGRMARYTTITTLPTGEALSISVQTNRREENLFALIAERERFIAGIIAKFNDLRTHFAEHYFPHLSQYLETARESFPSGDLHGGIKDSSALSRSLIDPTLECRQHDCELRFRIAGTAAIERLRQGIWADDEDDIPNLSFGAIVSKAGEVVQWEQ